MADDPDRQRLEDMLKASEQRRPAGGSSGEDASGQGRGEPREERPGDGGDGGAGNGKRPARATGSAATMVTAGLIIGGLSIPGALIPFLGLALGIAALVLGIVVSRRAADVRAKIAMGLGAVGIVLSIVLFVIALGATEEENGDSGDDSEDSDDSDDEDGGGDDENGGGDGDSEDSSSLLPPNVVAVTLNGVRI